MPRLEFTVEEAPKLLGALLAHDPKLYYRALDALQGHPSPHPERRPDGLVHVARAER